jgi:hypothetical protein
MLWASQGNIIKDGADDNTTCCLPMTRASHPAPGGQEGIPPPCISVIVIIIIIPPPCGICIESIPVPVISITVFDIVDPRWQR